MRRWEGEIRYSCILLVKVYAFIRMREVMPGMIGRGLVYIWMDCRVTSVYGQTN